MLCLDASARKSLSYDWNISRIGEGRELGYGLCLSLEFFSARRRRDLVLITSSAGGRVPSPAGRVSMSQ